MIWLAVAVLAILAVAPLAMPLLRRPGLRGRQDSDVALHRAQLTELDRDLAEGRIAGSEHATAVLEVQRRLLAAAGRADAAPVQTSPWPLLLALAAIPAGAVGLYLVHGRPGLPAAPLAERMAEADRRRADAQDAVRQLRAVLAKLDPRSDQAVQGYVLLGNVTASGGDFRAAAEAWNHALAVRFDPLLAARTADAEMQADGKLTDQSTALFRRALAAAPPDAPWRKDVEDRLANAPR